MKVVLADIEEKALAEAENEMKAAGAKVLAVPTDVSKAGDVEALAQKTLAGLDEKQSANMYPASWRRVVSGPR
jgi:NAD(P)-dependent dehydrogenase (short-subunit alcohol dehydrogenase family)